MRAFLAHVKAEVRDQRSGLIAVCVSLLVLTPLAFWAFSSRLVEVDAERATALIVAIALVLYLFAVVGDLFAGETRRDTLAFLRRTPRGLGLAFAAKVFVMFLGFAAVVVWESLVLTASWNLWGRSIPVELGATVEAAFLSPLALLAAILAAWVTLASTWLRHGGIAILLAPMLAAAVVVPGIVWAQANRAMASYVVPDVSDAFWWYALAFVAVPIGAAAWSWLGGRRVLRSAWSAAWRGMVVVLVVSMGTYAVGAVRLAGVRDIQPHDADFHIYQGFVSPDGGRLYLTVARQTPSGHSLTPARSWAVDVATGSWAPIGRWGEVVDRPTLGGIYWSLEPQPRLILHRKSTEDDKWLLVWIDAETSDVIKVVPSDVRTPDVATWYDEAGRCATWVRDRAGRRVWLRRRDWAVRREDGEGVETIAKLPPEAHPHSPIPGGWKGWGQRGAKSMILDADTGEFRAVDRSLVSEWVSPWQYRKLGRGEDAKASRWWIVDARTGEQKPAVGAPDDWFASLTQTCVLGRTGEIPRRLVLWNPGNGTTTPLSWPGDAAVDVVEIRMQGRAGNGEAAVLAKHDGVWAVASLNPDTREVQALVDGLEAPPWVIALTADGAAVAIEDERRIVRYGPEEGKREVLFPR